MKAAPSGAQTFVGDQTGAVALNGNPYDYTLSQHSEADDEGGGGVQVFHVLTAINGSGEYRIATGLGRVGFISGAFCLVESLPVVIPSEHSPPSWGALGAPFVSHAQIGEDILLMRALGSVPPQDGFYIDVGAYDPDQDSVTRAFYDRGWRGVNLEPSKRWFDRLQEARPRDINIQAAASSRSGVLSFYVNDGEQLGTLEQRFAHSGDSLSVQQVQAVRLADVCAEHAGAPVHFLKIDVEGHERDVLEGMDFDACRPWIVIVEAVAPNRPDIPTFGEWEDLLTRGGYHFAAADELNRYYVSKERRDLAACFRLPLDNYIRSREVEAATQSKGRIGELEAELRELRSRRPRIQDLWRRPKADGVPT